MRIFGLRFVFLLAFALVLSFAGADAAEETAATSAEAEQLEEQGLATEADAPAEQLPVEKERQAGSSKRALLDEIIVSAKLGGTTLQDYSGSISVINSEEIDTFGITDTSDLQIRTPSLVAAQELMIPKIFIRGIGKESNTAGQDPGIAMHVDGVYMGRPMAALATQIDLNRVEVLSGPQGTTYGRNATGGAVNYYSNNPVHDTLVTASLMAGNYSHKEGKVIGNVDISDSFAVRGAFFGQKHDGYVLNLTDGSYLDDAEIYAGRVSALFDPGDDLKVVLAVDGQKEDSNGPSFLALNNPLLILNKEIVTDERKTRLGPDDQQPRYTRRKNYGVTLTADWMILENLNLKSISSWRDFHHEQAQDADASSQAIVGAYLVEVNAKQISQELNLSGSWRDLNWILGGYFFQETLDQVNDVRAALSQVRSLYKSDDTTTSYAGFGEVSYSVLDWLSLEAGLRYTFDKKERDRQKGLSAAGVATDDCAPGAANFVPNILGPIGLLIPVTLATSLDDGLVTVHEEKDWTELTWRAGANVSVGFGNAYGKVSRGYKAGGFSDISCAAGFEPEEVVAYEVGFRSAPILDDRLTFSVAAFYYDYTNLQVQQIDYLTLSTFTVNAKKAEVRGVEFTAELSPLRGFLGGLLDGFSIDGHLSYLDNKYTDFMYQPSSLDPTLQLAGTPITRSPKLSGLIGAQLAQPIGTGTLTLRVEAYGTRSYLHGPGGAQVSEFLVQKPYWEANAYLIYANPELYGMVAKMFARNFTDSFHYTSVLPSLFGDTGFANPPRTWGGELTMTF